MTEAEVSGVDNPYRYSTKEWDEKSGLYYFGARYYSPEIGRWTQRDSAGTADGLNLYLYVGNEPIARYDAWGLQEMGWDPSGAYMEETYRILLKPGPKPPVTYQDVDKALCLLRGLGLLDGFVYRYGARIYLVGIPAPGAGLSFPVGIILINPYFPTHSEVENLAVTLFEEFLHVTYGPGDLGVLSHAMIRNETYTMFDTSKALMLRQSSGEYCCDENGRKWELTAYGKLLRDCGIGTCVTWSMAVPMDTPRKRVP